MQKVYTVLINNKKEGPYNLQELQQLALKPTDLIWVEGRSAAWSYPSEIKELQAFNLNQDARDIQIQNQTIDKAITETPISKGTKKIFVSLPGGNAKNAEAKEATQAINIEEKAEALRQRILNQASPAPAAHEAFIETRLNRSMDDVAGDYANWAIQHKNKKSNIKFNKKQLLFAVVALAVFVGIYMMLPQSTTKNEPFAIKEEIQNSQPLAAENNNQDLVVKTPIPETMEQLREPEVAKPNASNQNKNIQKQNTEAILSNKNIQPQTTVTETIEPVAQEAPEEAVIAKEPEKKKSIGEAIDGFFDKFKSKNKETAEGTANTKDGERKSSRRSEETAKEPETVDVTSQVKVTSTAPRDNWMLGIKGQKLTLQNNSKVIINSAWVTIEYFGEDDVLLDTKKIEFKNIKPAQKVSQPLPDHRLASYTTQQVTMATGIQQ